MPKIAQKVTPCLWFDMQAEEAAQHYTSIFPDSSIQSVTRFGEDSPGPAGQVMVVTFTLFGQEFMGLNGGPQFPFTEAISLHVTCETQEEVDTYWSRLLDGGEESQCGWLKDRYGVSWQIIPRVLGEMLGDADAEKANRVMQAMLPMQKVDIATLERAYAGR